MAFNFSGERDELKIAEDRFLCVSVSENKNNKQKRKGLDVYKYEVGFIDKDDSNKIYVVDITIKENLNGKFYYDHNLTNIETLGVPRNSDVKTSTTSVYNESSENSSESQVKKSEGELQHVDSRFLVEQDPDKHPIAYASIQMAKYMLFGKGQGFLLNVS